MLSAAVASPVEVSGILTRLAGLRKEWGEISGERVCCELPWAPFPRQQNARALEDAELQFGDGLLPSDFGSGGRGYGVRKGTWKRHNSVLIYIRLR